MNLRAFVALLTRLLRLDVLWELDPDECILELLFRLRDQSHLGPIGRDECLSHDLKT